ncbi:MAG: hypothetical protein LAT63_17425 [Marinobacter sp.]|nr:hypothetical protein [Marinobacter sp.]
MKQFDVKASAVAAGYVKAHKVHARHRWMEIYARDISGRHSVGYKYALVVGPGGAWCGPALGELGQERFAISEDVWFSLEKNQLSQPGCFSVMFSPEALSSGIQRAIEAIDRFFSESEGAQKEEQRLIAEAQETAERDHARAIRRAERLAQKYGAENLAAVHRDLLR